MKVNIGPYMNWFGPYQFADLLQKVGVSEDTCARIGDWLNKREWVVNAFKLLDRFRQRRVKVQIHEYDIWSADDTLSLIILPMLKKLRAKKGAGFIDPADVPPELRPDQFPTPSDNDVDDGFYARWHWALDEMIWAFEQKTLDDPDAQFYDAATEKYDHASYLVWQKRVSRGFALFGRYFEALWY